ncbi:hypothetical protein HYFRA_00012104 [Hymenoscyphus fraxineus]|uniref:Uncharacterized protein n=1 Tax=Hymenoscyphus fraxineus TaxID=746836 RepID=A0A9N9L377_9HELO|nr:hypothetical protein HYFRA_00012104 [Hymenoscyphus fraxineus]
MLAPRSYLFTSQHSKETKHERARAPKRKNSLPKPEVTATMTPTKTTTSLVTDSDPRPTTPSSPVVIPLRGHHDDSHYNQRLKPRKERQHGRRYRTVHSPEVLSPSVAALLAITQIPAQRMAGSTRTRSTGQRLTVDAILKHTGVTEKEYSLSLTRSPLDFLLCPPEELLEDDLAGSETGQESVMSGRTLSSESMPSLADDSISEASPSLNSFVTPGSRGRKSLPSRRIRLLSTDSTIADHPLSSPSSPEFQIEELDFRVFQKDQDQTSLKSMSTEAPEPPRKSAFKSNLTASLRALRSAAKSFSSLTTPMLTPDDFLTRSIISIDPSVPFTDERMPPRLEDTPTPALRRYLNPTTNAPIEAHVPPSLSQTMPATKCTASIQMETYKVSRSARGTSPSVISRRTQITEDIIEIPGPVPRQREMRENSDFIRIAVMEMAMRRKGKLDDQKPGRAKWALPPKKESTKKYQIGKDGVPLRWIAQFQ